MARALSETGKAVGLAIYALGQNREKFVPATITNTVEDLSAQNCSNRLKHFKDLGYIVRGADGLYSVPEDKIDPLWDYLTSVGVPVKTERMAHKLISVPKEYFIDKLDVMDLLAVADYEEGEYAEIFEKYLDHQMNTLYSIKHLLNDDTISPIPNVDEEWYKTTKAKLEEWMQ